MTSQKTQFSGLKFPFQLDDRNRLAALSEEEAVRQSIRLILCTRKGERIMRPEFGSELFKLDFQPNDTHALTNASRYAREALTKWESRIELLSVMATFDSDLDSRSTLTIRYRLLSNGVEYQVKI